MKSLIGNFWPTMVVMVLAVGLLMFGLREKPSSITENTVTTELSRVDVAAIRGLMFVWRALPDSITKVGQIDSMGFGLTDGSQMIVRFEDTENK